VTRVRARGEKLYFKVREEEQWESERGDRKASKDEETERQN
jgi:hypothetical protein